MFLQPYKKIIYFLIACVFLLQHKLIGQLQQDTTKKKAHYLLLPVFFRSPENGFAYGLTGSASFNTAGIKDSLTRTSVIQAVGFLTTKQQNIQLVDATIYSPKENYIFVGQLSHSYFPDRFWGIGPNTTDNGWEHYLYEQMLFSPHIKKQIKKHVFVGLLYEFQSVYRINYTPGGIFESSDFYGKKSYNMSGPGLSIAYDTRNSSFWPTKGLFVQTQVTDFRKEFLSDYNVIKWVTDLRYFIKLHKGHILAMQLYDYETFGNTPLRQLASFGGANNMRGFYQGRFRDKSMLSFITEYRLNIYRKFSMVVFGGVGNVYNNYSELTTSPLKYSYGGGLRYSLLDKEKLNLRLDYGYSNKFNKGFYFTVGECF